MNCLPLESFSQVSPIVPIYWYEGHCPTTGRIVRLPRTAQAEAIARELMQHLARDDRHSYEGKMYGVLLVQTPDGVRVLQAFSGLLNGSAVVEGWVPPIPGRDRVALEEAETLTHLTAIKQALITWQQIPERQQYTERSRQFADRLQRLLEQHQPRKQQRQHQRQILLATLTGATLAAALEAIDEQSRQDGLERRHLKRDRAAVLQPLQQAIAQADEQIRLLKQQRKLRSRQFQTQMHTAYWLTNFAGESRSLAELSPNTNTPTGTGDCCAPKLLHYAATHRLQPIALAEFWWGLPTADKVPGSFYGACHDRCQPLMGFLLSGLPTAGNSLVEQSAIAAPLYEDEWLIAINKPAGLLSVPGRADDRQDSVLSRYPATIAAHRLDQDTSGILLLTRDRASHRHLSQQFQQRQIYKVYEAILAATVDPPYGIIDLPLRADPHDRPRQVVDVQSGKPCQTQFTIVTPGDQPRAEFRPLTGRTHQLRIHAAIGLNAPILGDRLYGSARDRLYLHARELQFTHPRSGQRIHLQAATPF